MKKQIIKYITFLFLNSFFISQIQAQTTDTNLKIRMFMQDAKWGFLTSQGDTIVKAEYDMVFDFNKYGIAPVVKEGNWHYINLKGEAIFRPFVYDNGPDYFSEGMARFVKNDSIGFFNEKGEVVIDASFDFATSFHEGLASFCNDCAVILHENGNYSVTGGNWGYINNNGTVIISPIFDAAGFFKNGRASVKKKGVEFFIDKNGEKVK